MSRGETTITPSRYIELLRERYGTKPFTRGKVRSELFEGITKYSTDRYLHDLHREGWLHHTHVGGFTEYTVQDTPAPCPSCKAADAARDPETEIPAAIREDVKDVLFLREQFPGTAPAKNVDALLEQLNILAEVGRAIRKFSS